MNINEHQDQRYTRGDNNGRDLYLLGVNVLVFLFVFCLKCSEYKPRITEPHFSRELRKSEPQENVPDS